MIGLSFSIQNLLDSGGLPVAATGLLIVFFALTLITLFIAGLPRLLGSIAHLLPEETHVEAERSSAKRNANPDDEAVVAAIGYVLHTRRQNAET